MAILNDSTIGLLERALDTSLYRQNVINANLANIDTPGYVPHDVDFASALNEMMDDDHVTLKRTSKNHVGSQRNPRGAASTFERADGLASPDGNAVDLDKQMARSAQNLILYQASTRVVSKKLAILKYAINEGGH